MTFEERWLAILPDGGAAGPRTRARMSGLLDRMPHLGHVSDDVVMVALPVLPGLLDLYVAERDEDSLVRSCATFLPELLSHLGSDVTVNLRSESTAPFVAYGFAPLEQIHYYTLDPLGPGRPDPRVRIADGEDLQAILAIDAASFPLPYRRGPEELNMHVQGASIVRVMDIGGQLAGFSILQPLGPRYHLGAVGVAPAHQGQGLGRLLLEDAIHAAHERGAASIGLTTQTRNVRARRMYEQRGFTGEPHPEFWARAGVGLEVHLF